MGQKQTGDGWTVEVQGNIMIWEFLPGMELSAFKEEAYPVYEELLADHAFDGMVTDVRIDDPFTSEVFDVWEKSALRAEQAVSNGGLSWPRESQRFHLVGRSILADWKR